MGGPLRRFFRRGPWWPWVAVAALVILARTSRPQRLRRPGERPEWTFVPPSLGEHATPATPAERPAAPPPGGEESDQQRWARAALAAGFRLINCPIAEDVGIAAFVQLGDVFQESHLLRSAGSVSFGAPPSYDRAILVSGGTARRLAWDPEGACTPGDPTALESVRVSVGGEAPLGETWFVEGCGGPPAAAESDGTADKTILPDQPCELRATVRRGSRLFAGPFASFDPAVKRPMVLGAPTDAVQDDLTDLTRRQAIMSARLLADRH